MSPQIATNTRVDLDGLLEFTRPRHNVILLTSRADRTPQASPVTCGVDSEGRFVISTYRERAKAANVRRTPTASVVVLSDDFGGPWVQVDGEAEILDMPEALDALVDYYRTIAGEHPDWADYREAMRRQDKSLIRVAPRRWGPIATGGFPARLVP
ncbi:MAG TPA: PPOX class F420-dependent oxidoreductase [Streptosporangiaceae bacterium]|nr:PPOX class F420-dependent oxidoreductase [Streptosporangiaceae bacterium]